MSARSWAPWILATLVLAVAVHLATVWYLPHFVMNRALAKMGAPNMIHHGGRVTAASRGVVRPSPDLLYSTCPFDLSNGPIEIRATVPANTYWSVSLFDAETNNFFVRNDRQLNGKPLDLIVLTPKEDREPHQLPGRIFVRSPSEHGLALFRTLINDDSHFAAIDKARRQSNCAPLTK
jgi:uncharacterized membrane protein